MQKSTEVRWFIKEQQQVKEIEDWFKETGYQIQFSDENKFPRQDYYFFLPGIISLGLKIREPKIRKEDDTLLSKVEIKMLEKELGTIDLNHNNVGVVNSWIKFSFDLVPNDKTMLQVIKSFLPSSNPQDFGFIGYKKHWLKIDKDRMLVKYDIDQETLVEERTIISEGSGVEFTKIRVDGQTYFSLGIESFSDTNKQDENFYKTTSYLFERLKISNLTSDESLSYPEFLNLRQIAK